MVLHCFPQLIICRMWFGIYICCNFVLVTACVPLIWEWWPVQCSAVGTDTWEICWPNKPHFKDTYKNSLSTWHCILLFCLRLTGIKSLLVFWLPVCVFYLPPSLYPSGEDRINLKVGFQPRYPPSPFSVWPFSGPVTLSKRHMLSPPPPPPQDWGGISQK